MGESFTALMADVWGGIGDVVTTIVGSPLLLIPVGLAFAGGCIGLGKSLMGTRRRRR